MEEDSSHVYAFYIQGIFVSTMSAVASYGDGKYFGSFTNTFLALPKGNHTLKVVFKEYVEIR